MLPDADEIATPNPRASFPATAASTGTGSLFTASDAGSKANAKTASSAVPYTSIPLSIYRPLVPPGMTTVAWPLLMSIPTRSCFSHRSVHRKPSTSTAHAH
jgi:hypothetical protein